jgi:hypothetical protein
LTNVSGSSVKEIEMSQSSKNKTNTNPALEAIAFMAGEWDMELSNTFFLPSKKDVVHGDVTFRWIEGGALLVMQQGDMSTPPFATWVIGRDENDKEYTVQYFDDRKVSRIYRMSFEENTWKVWRDLSDSSQIFIGKVSDDRSVVEGYWEYSTDGGKTWQHDFDIKYTRK